MWSDVPWGDVNLMCPAPDYIQYDFYKYATVEFIIIILANITYNRRALVANL